MSATTLTPNAPHAENGAATKANRVLLAVPDGLDTRTLEDALRRNQLEPVFADESPISGTMSDVLSERLRRADAVLAVLPPENNPNVLFQIGFARGQGKRVVVLVADPDHALPDPAPGGLIVFQGTIRDAAKVGYAAEAARFAPRLTDTPAPTPSPSKPLGDEADTLLAHIPDGPLDAAAVHRVVKLLLLASGIEAASEDAAHLAGCWVSELGPWVRNPFLIHSCGDLESQRGGADEVAAFGATIRERSGDWGLTVAGRLGTGVEAEFGGSRVLVIELRDLLEAVRRQTLAGVILDHRRDRVRGRA
jgi:hypothetical protein